MRYMLQIALTKWTENYGYREDDIVILTDDAPHPAQMPTKANIRRGMQWLVKDAQPHDSLFFHCETRVLDTSKMQHLIFEYQILDTAAKPRISMETRKTGM